LRLPARGGNQFQAAHRVALVASIVVDPCFALFSESQKHKARRSLDLSGLRGEFLADDV